LKDTSAITASYYNLIPIKQEHTIRRIMINKQMMELETIGADHSVPTVIYGFSIIKNKLDPKYVSFTGKEIAQLVKAGEKVTIEVVDKKFSYVLDTSIKTIEENPQFLRYPVVIIECSLLMDDEYDLAEKKKHIHWNQLRPYVEKNSDTLFILTHFSLRYKDQDIKNFFDTIKINSNITNIHVWLTDPVKNLITPSLTSTLTSILNSSDSTNTNVSTNLASIILSTKYVC
jgi:ribonuclease BN (tRNA processing enzyme)